MNKKQQLGQFYTTNYDYILQNMRIPIDIKSIIEPFAGNCDLLNFIGDKSCYDIELYDIEPKNSNVIYRDTLNNPPCYNDRFVLTNPPYLSRNKNKDKNIYDKYKCNDLYKCFIINLINDICDGGIIIIPLNFISSIRKFDVNLRKSFMNIYHINTINIFEEKVFSDTKYSICSIQFIRKNSEVDEVSVIHIYPSKKIINFEFSSDNNYTIGGEIYNLPGITHFKIERATRLTKNTEYITNILVKCIDDSANNKLGLKLVDNNSIYIDNTDNLSGRSYATLVINKKLSIEQQEKLAQEFNNYINNKREKYNSLFLTNYRESNSIARKRISFDLTFKICNYLLSEIIKFENHHLIKL